MTKYRVYEIDDGGHSSLPPQIVEADTDVSAIAEAMLLVDGHDLEIWDEARRVGLIERCRGKYRSH